MWVRTFDPGPNYEEEGRERERETERGGTMGRQVGHRVTRGVSDTSFVYVVVHFHTYVPLPVGTGGDRGTSGWSSLVYPGLLKT